MNKITYSNLKLKQKEDIKEIDFNGNKIEVKQYLPINDAIDLVDITLQNSKEDNLYNPLKVDMYYHLYLIYLMTNITFTDKQKENEEKLYDVLLSNGLIDQVIAEIPESIYTGLLNKIEEKIQIELQYNTTAAAIIKNIINELPKNAQIASDIVENFDKEKFQNVIDFARSINGGRNIE